MLRYYSRTNSGNIVCYYLDVISTLNKDEEEIVLDILKPTIDLIFDYKKYVEIGPHLNMETPWCSNAKSILIKCGI